MVGGIDEQSVFGQAGFIKGIHELADYVIHKMHASQVSLAQTFDVVIVKKIRGKMPSQIKGIGVICRDGIPAMGGQVGACRMTLPQFWRGIMRKMGSADIHAEQKRSVHLLALVAQPGQRGVYSALVAAPGGFLGPIPFSAARPVRTNCNRLAGHVSVARQFAVAGIYQFRKPQFRCRTIHIRFSGMNGMDSLFPQYGPIGGIVMLNDIGIIVALYIVDAPPTHESTAAGKTQGRRTVSIFKYHALCSHALHVWIFQKRMAKQ